MGVWSRINVACLNWKKKKVWKRLDLAFLKKEKRNESKEEVGGGRKRQGRVERVGIQRDKWESATSGRKITGWRG